MVDKDLDIVIYGASGFTGRLCVRYFAEHAGQVRWAIAGRNSLKLKEIIKTMALEVEVIVADGDDAEALDRLTARTRVVLSTAGPFHRYGSKLVASCVKNASHYADITGENFWVKELIDKHHTEAASKGIRIVPSCGYDSLPSDLATLYAVNKMAKAVKRVDCFHTAKGSASGGTIETIFSIGDLKLGKDMRNPYLLNPEGSYTKEQKQESWDTMAVKKNKMIDRWTGPFMMAFANTRVVRRSAALMEAQGQGYGPGFVYQEGAYFKRYLSAFLMAVFTGLLVMLITSPLRHVIRRMLLKPGEGPSEKTMLNGHFKCLLVAEAEDGEKRVFSMYAKGDPGYRLTARFLCEAALLLAGDLEQLPGGKAYGGVLTPATALGQAMIDRLSERDVHLEAVAQVKAQA
ncbi:MAG TPA: saccharopine dehydrogenase [Flavobacteriales bacterium]|nr:saccharopine dehydrogenase [Flavobacteriales bacterium]